MKLKTYTSCIINDRIIIFYFLYSGYYEIISDRYLMMNRYPIIMWQLNNDFDV